MPARPDTGLTSTDLAALQEALVRLRAENEDDVEKARVTLSTLTTDQSLASASLREVVANAEYMIADGSEIVGRIDAALARMDQGTYGICDTCGQPIPLARLELRPYGATCVPCAS